MRRHNGPIEGWHFINEDFKLGNGDNRIVKHNVWLTARDCSGSLSPLRNRLPTLCHHGMHMSRGIAQAADYASHRQNILCRVEIRGDILWSYDKLVGRERRVLWWIPAVDLFKDYLVDIRRPFVPSIHYITEWNQLRHEVVGSIYGTQVSKYERKVRQDLLRRLAWKHAEEQWEFVDE